MKTLAIFIIFFLSSNLINSTIINVPEYQPTIQAGINISADSDTVLVQPGTYFENINYNGKNITVASLFLTTADTTYISQTVIDGSQPENEYGSSVVTFANDEDSTTVLSGFSLINGSGNPTGAWSNQGGGIYCCIANPTLSHLLITENSNLLHELVHGGGIYCEEASLKIKNVIIRENEASFWTWGGAQGGGIYALNSEITLENVSIKDNEVIAFNSGSKGGGIWAENSTLTLINVEIQGNLVLHNFAKGGGIYCSNSSIYMNNVQIKGNTSDFGGGIYTCNNSDLTFGNELRCNIYSNNIDNPTGLGRDIMSEDCYVDVIVDTFTVLNPTDYYTSPIVYFTVDILHGIEEDLINSDVYVAVDGDNSNSGTSSEEPFKTINYALSRIYADSLNRNTIHLAPGTYSTTTNEEVYPLNWVNYVDLCGESIEEIILDAENDSRIFEFNYTTEATIENLTISNGHENKGGGIYCGTLSSPHLFNIIITGNSANYGGGIYCDDQSAPILENVNVEDNESNYGGGIYCYEGANPFLENVEINDNTAVEDGGGLYCNNSNPNLVSVSITSNEAVSGAGIFTANNSSLSCENVSITENNAISSGGGIFCAQSDSSVFQNLIIANNEACLGGGFYFSNSSSSALIDILIIENVAENGGGIYCSNSDFSSVNSLLENNHALYDGGGIYLDYWTDLAIENTELTGNISENKGGGIFLNADSSLDAVNSAFNYNFASDHGGGLYCSISNVSIIGSQFLGNTGYCGGGISNFASAIEIINTTLCYNSNTEIDECGAGICCLGSGSNVNIKNSISWDNLPCEISIENIIMIISYSNIQGGESEIAINGNGVVIWQDGNIDEDPLFAIAGEDPSLLEGSPCIDAGDPDTLSLNLPPYDIIGNQRIWDGDGNGTAIIDMGAYEYGALPYDIEENVVVITPGVHLYQNYPNPFNPAGAGRSPETTISYQLSESSSVSLLIYNIKGQLVKTLVNDVIPAGEHSIIWDGKNQKNQPVASGIYLYRLKTDNLTRTRKMTLMK